MTVHVIDIPPQVFIGLNNSTHHKQSPTVYFGQELEELILLSKKLNLKSQP